MIALTAAGAGATALQLPRAADLETDRLLDLTRLGRLARVTALGRTTRGRPVDLISVGSGSRAALIVGAPHPNEPIGCLTLLRLLSRLATDVTLREQSDWCWHVVPAIDLDGLVLNEGWFRAPLSIDGYCRNFYRPPFALQPEYAFPIKVGAYDFASSTPENACWQRALAVARPQLQCSLHGCDSGGTFYLCSENRPALFEQLLRLPARFGMPLNPVGEPFSEMDIYQPGIVAFPAIAQMLRTASAAGADPAAAWNAGDSSAGFGARLYGTLSLACEVPLWDDRRLHRPGPSPFSIVDTLRAQSRQLREDHALLERSGALLDAGDLTPDESALAAPLHDALATNARQSTQLETLAAAQDPRQRLSWANLVQYEPGTAGWRTPAMLWRLARLRRAAPVADRAEALLRQRISAQSTAHLRAVPLALSSALQLAAIQTAARLSTA